ncbi:MAG: hypothetical protein ACYC2K_08045 [Gemmatimonadales bacterium]
MDIHSVRENNPKGITGFRMDQLASAFDRVRDPRDWMAPIRAVIQAEDQILVAKAVLWFTGTVARFEPDPGSADRLIVVSPGYRLGLVARDQAAAQPTGMLPSMSATLARANGNPPPAAPAQQPAAPAVPRRVRRIEPYVRPLDVRWDGAIKRYDLFLTWKPYWVASDSQDGGAP